jgi:multidrug efflux pump subunit AcrB
MATRKERKLAGSGGRLVAIGLPLVVIGVVLALILSGTASGIGAAIAVLGSLPVIAGAVLLLSSGTERHSRKGRPYA